MVAGPDAGLVVPVGAGEYTVGRGGGDVALTNGDVSRTHCVISVSAAGSGVSCTVRDAESRNGTGLDGVPVGSRPEPVQPGQLISVGRDTLTVALPLAESAMLEPGDPADPFGWRLAGLRGIIRCRPSLSSSTSAALRASVSGCPAG